MASAEKTREKMMMVFDFIKSYTLKFGFPPSIREICAEFNISSTATAAYYIDKLEEYGYIKKNHNRNRAMKILYDNNSNFTSNYCPNLVSAPLLKKVDKTKNNKNILEKYIIPTKLFNIKSDGNFIIQANSENLINEDINKNDFIIINRNANIHDQDYIFVNLENQNFIKRAKIYKDKIYVFYNNEKIEINDTNKIGKVVSIIRNFNTKEI